MDEKNHNLRKELSLFDLIMLGLGCIIGAGIFVIMGKTINIGGKYVFLGFLIVGIISLIMGLVYVECYSRYKSGITEFLAVKDSLGEKMGKISQYFVYFYAIFTSITVIVAITKYTGFFRGNYFKEVGFSVMILLVIMFINLSGIKISKSICVFIGIMLITIFSGIIFMGSRKINFKKILSGPDISWKAFLLSTILALYLFNGYDVIVKMSPEARDDQDAKKAIVWSVCLTSFFYVMIILILISILGYVTIKKTYVPLSKVYEFLLNKGIAVIVFWVGVIVLFNTALMKLIGASRFMYGLGINGEIVYSNFFSKLNGNQVPINAIIITFVISVLCAMINNEVVLAVITNFSVMFNLIVMSLSLLVLRWNDRNNEKEKLEHNYIRGNINNIPVLVVLALITLIYFMFTVLKNKFWIGSKMIQ